MEEAQRTLSKTQGHVSPRPSLSQKVNLANTTPNLASMHRRDQSPNTPGKSLTPQKQSPQSRPQTPNRLTPVKKSATPQKQPPRDRPQTPTKTLLTPQKATTPPKRMTPVKKSATPQKQSPTTLRQPSSPVPKMQVHNQRIQMQETDSVPQLFCELCNRTLDPAAADVAYLECGLHCFHDACLAVWLQTSNKCPTCGEVTQASR